MLEPKDIRIFNYDSRPLYSGSFGFHMPRGVHIIHLPTGLEVKEDSERSQHKNKFIAAYKTMQGAENLPQHLMAIGQQSEDKQEAVAAMGMINQKVGSQ